MRISVTERQDLSGLDLRPAGDVAPSLALPWILKLRYEVLAGEAALILAAAYLFQVPLAIEWLVLPLAVTAVSNLLLRKLAASLGDRPALGATLALDIFCLTALLALSGGPSNPFSLLYLVQITLSAVVLSKEWTWALGLLSVLGFGFLFPFHIRVGVFESHHAGPGFSTHLIGMWIAFAAAALLISVSIGEVSEALRSREQEVLRLQDQISRHERLAIAANLRPTGGPISARSTASSTLVDSPKIRFITTSPGGLQSRFCIFSRIGIGREWRGRRSRSGSTPISIRWSYS